MDIHKFAGEEFKLSAIVPEQGFVSGLMKASDVPGFRVWTTPEINEALAKREPRKQSSKFQGKDWIFNQGNLGSCCPAAAKGVLRRAMLLNGVNSVPDLNHEFTYALTNRGADNGAILAEVSKSIQDVGMPRAQWEKHPLNTRWLQRQYGPEDYRDAALNKAEVVFEIETEAEMLTLLLSGQGAVEVAVHVGNNFNNLDSNGFPGAQSYGVGNHAVAVDDVWLINSVPAYHSANSWGLNWGINGTCMYTWDKHFITTVKNHRFFGVMSVDVQARDDDAPIAKV